MQPKTCLEHPGGSGKPVKENAAVAKQPVQMSSHSRAACPTPTVLKPINKVLEPVHAALKAEAALQVR